MSTLKYDVSEVEVQEDRDFSTPVPAGLYSARVTECEETTSKSSGNPMLAITLEIEDADDEKWNGRLLWDYIVLNDSSEWKLAQFIRALGKKDRGTLNLAKVIGNQLKVRVKIETDPDYGPRSKVASLLPYEDEEEDDEETDDEEIEDDEADDEEADDDDDEDEDDEEDDEDDDDDDDDEEDDEGYEDWTMKDLETEVKGRGLTIKTTKKGAAKKRYLAAKLEKDDESDEGSDPF